VAQVTIPGATSADLSTDGATVWVGTALNEIVAVDSTSLQVKRRYMQVGVATLPSAVFDRPEEVLAVAKGKCFVRLRQATSTEALVASLGSHFKFDEQPELGGSHGFSKRSWTNGAVG
jgi:hypothetical protein